MSSSTPFKPLLDKVSSLPQDFLLNNTNTNTTAATIQTSSPSIDNQSDITQLPPQVKQAQQQIINTTKNLIALLFHHDNYVQREVERFVSLHEPRVKKQYVFPLDNKTKTYLTTMHHIKVQKRKERELKEKLDRHQNFLGTVQNVKQSSKALLSSTLTTVTSLSTIMKKNTQVEQDKTTLAPTPENDNNNNTQSQQESTTTVPVSEPVSQPVLVPQPSVQSTSNLTNSNNINNTQVSSSSPSATNNNNNNNFVETQFTIPTKPKLIFTPELTHTPEYMDDTTYYIDGDRDNTLLTTISIALPTLVFATTETTAKSQNDVILTNNNTLPNAKGRGDLLTFLQHTIERAYEFNERLCTPYNEVVLEQQQQQQQQQSQINQTASLQQQQDIKLDEKNEELYYDQLIHNITDLNNSVQKLKQNLETISQISTSRVAKRESTRVERQAIVKQHRLAVDAQYADSLADLNSQHEQRMEFIQQLRDQQITMPPIELNVTEPLLIQQQRYLTQLAANAAQVNNPPPVLSSPRSNSNNNNNTNSPNSSFSNNTSTSTFNPQLQQMATPVQKND